MLNPEIRLEGLARPNIASHTWIDYMQKRGHPTET